MGKYYIKRGKYNFKKYIKLFGIFFILLGISFFLYFFFPVISYQFFLSSSFSKSNIEVPIPKYLVINENNNSIGTLVASGLASLTQDFTDARNWYPGISPESGEIKKADFYSISIPRLKIENAIVSTRDYDLSEHLVQYFGTSIPGENGTAVIFGHSTLPYLFNPKNYKTIFANMHTLKIGDELFTQVQGVTYRYKIFSILITNPQDTNMFSQSYDHSYITLVTCTPPGTIWKRLVVRATLETVTN